MKELKKLYKKPSELTKKLIEEHDELIRMKRAEFINHEIQELFGINLVTCPNCAMIHSSFDYEDSPHPYCVKQKGWIDCRCGIGFFHHEAPDLFY